tara:strand:+ start:1413 stop:2084 length:672 start_codon:yes stop_codon:yes gene_type:complete
MHQRISKKIILYLFIFFIFGTFNNKNFQSSNFFGNNNLNIIDISRTKNDNIYLDLSKLKNQNLFFLNKDKVLAIINNYKIVEDFIVFKNYPNNFSYKIEKTKFLAVVKKDGSDFYIGANGNLIEANHDEITLPYIFGNIEISEFLKLKNIIDSSNLDYSKIDKFYYFKSKRWDIKIKNGLLLRLPNKEIEKSFEMLNKILSDDQFDDVKEIDLRQINQVVING